MGIADKTRLPERVTSAKIGTQHTAAARSLPKQGHPTLVPTATTRRTGAPLSRGRQRRDFVFPPHSPGLRIGLFGGSFNPPHASHRAASLLAMKRLRLDHVWWLVTPGNPLKDTSSLPPLTSRIAAARRIAKHPRIHVTGLEAEIGTRFTAETLAILARRCAGVRFVWIMGADNLPGFHRWRNWRRIFAITPVAVVDRPSAGHAATAGPGPQAFAAARLPEFMAGALADRRPPAWVFLHGLRSPLSSTELRRKNAGQTG